MNVEMAILLGQQALTTAVILAGPLLVTALVVGTVVSLLQSVTQVQEITLVFVPKILAVFLVLALSGGWMLRQATSFGSRVFSSIEDIGQAPP